MYTYNEKRRVASGSRNPIYILWVTCALVCRAIARDISMIKRLKDDLYGNERGEGYIASFRV